MKILCIGDIVGKAGRSFVQQILPKMREELKLDFVIANVENAAGGFGITPRLARQLFREGCDVLTLGDHVWDKEELKEYLDEEEKILRPANFPEGIPGHGWSIVETASGVKVGVINLLGRIFMRYNVTCPFLKLSEILSEIKKETSIIIVDFHAEATSEKVALGFYVDGKASAVVGTHTHIPTADAKILPQGTGYITDLGMTGPYDSVIGQNKEKIIQRFLTTMPHKFEVAQDDVQLHGVVIDIDEETGQTKKIERIQRKDI